MADEKADETPANNLASEVSSMDAPEGKWEYVECVTVFRAHNDEEAMVVQSVLGSAGIPCYAKGQVSQDLIGWRLGTGYSLALGPVEIQVQAEHAEAARRIIAERVEQKPEAEE